MKKENRELMEQMLMAIHAKDTLVYPRIPVLYEWLQNRHPMSLSQTSKLFFGRSLSNACTDDRDAAF